MTRLLMMVTLLSLVTPDCTNMNAKQVSNKTYDLVICGGRVIDPETHLDAVRDIGVSGRTIETVSSVHLEGRHIIDARGLVVAPGFIDLHQHGQTAEDAELKAFDGVTTALEMELGRPDVRQYLHQRRGHWIINYGTTANYAAARALAFHAPIPVDAALPLPASGSATNEPATPAQIHEIENRLRSEIGAGALGIGMGIQYTPGATRLEIIDIFRVAAQYHLPVYTHVRSAGTLEPGSSVESVSEVIAAAAITGAALHIAHINSSCSKSAAACLAIIAGARDHGIDVTTEAYPYTAAMTQINSAFFNPGWREKFALGFDALALPDSGERLNRERFEELHASTVPTNVLMFLNDDATVDSIVLNPLVLIASDGEIEHPRNAGTFCRVLARYVRKQRSLSLLEAISKMSFQPAQVLSRSTRDALRKGRIQVNADADIVMFDPAVVSDRSTYASPRQHSVGIKYVLVGGTPIIENGKLVPHVFPGAALTGDTADDPSGTR